jgi:hypothetical protein
VPDNDDNDDTQETIIEVESCLWSMRNIVECSADDQAMAMLMNVLSEGIKKHDDESGDFYRRAHTILTRLGHAHQAMHSRIHELEHERDQHRQAHEQAMLFMRGTVPIVHS